ncbi:ATP-dependent DNA helicase pif1 [Trametes pubescens]|uniref:ATP-dependent DNA helicase n=1 Tax=Trametes pubescens TaxID=154538 RepID=A0A1M2VDP9_TRAPU|nr:ATP-dependent DNA helicase pif1 [Trametes pubescens]OJT14492.1 ATP-dependent DNA helicase pif1 [Trametes pubescens]
MNVLYECLDARDDYSAQRRANAGSNDHAADDMIPFGLSDSQHCANDSLAFLSGEFEFTQESLADLVADGSIGKKTARHRDHMERMRRLLPDDPVGAQAVAREHVFRERPKRSTAEWKVVVARAKQAYLDKANGASSTGPTPAPGTARRPPTYGLPPIVEVLTVETMAILRSHAFDISRGPQDRDLLLLHTVIEKFSLNKQQMIAFSIAAKYLHHHETGPLRMYLGGMAGTGKSQVLLATICFLDARNESYRLLVLGPTGSSAALIGGFTYHSALGICVTSEQGFSTATTIAKLRGRIQRVSLIFIDEISMISCVDFVRINRQLAKALPESTDTFGGKAVILAGDFAQLPPPGAAPSLYSNSIGAWSKSASQYNQDCAIGKALWHQFTTVVILRQNMRQQGLSRDDADFRVALENMRYARCTAHDIALLQTRIWYPNVGDKRLMAPDFRDISIITARNAHRDAVNEMKAPAFAARCGKKLYRFVSLDTWGHSKESTSIRKAQRAYNATADPSRTSNIIPRKVQEQLWALPPSLTDHQAGVLQLCEGMPVLLKYNEATELCATNGAEAVVHCWDSQRLGTHHEVLNTLYVRLVNPPRPVQLPGLELNVIPMPRTRKSIKCTLPVDDLTVSIQREQVMVLPNFAMTDFASQGRTRPHNVCHLEDCKNHQSIYTCLSRSSSLAGTLIVGNFDFSKLRGGASGALRREFRELELLDEITRLRTEKNLPSHVNGESRGALLTAFQSWKGPRHVPDQVHEALNWSTEDIASLRPELLFDRVIEAAGLCKPTSSFERTVKRTRAENWTPVPTKKRRNALATADVSAYDINETQRAAPPSGLLWDSQNWSCAYDALLTPFFNRYKECDDAWLASVAPGNNLMQVIHVTAMPPTEPEYVMDLPVADSTGRWLLIGCIYHGANHFVSRYLDTDLTLWFHDGALGKRECTHDYTRSLSPPSTFTRLPQDVLNLTLDQLSLADIQALRKTCVAADIIASSYWSHRFDTLLCHYFSDTRGVLE